MASVFGSVGRRLGGKILSLRFDFFAALIPSEFIAALTGLPASSASGRGLDSESCSTQEPKFGIMSAVRAEKI